MPPQIPEINHSTNLPDATRLVDSLVFSTTKRARRRARQLLDQLPDNQAVPALILALREAETKQTFQTIANLLSDRATDECVDELARQARENKRFPRMPLRAMARCSNPAAVDRLVEFVEHGSLKQRRTAIRALGEINAVAAIEALCRLARMGEGTLKADALRILQGMGRPARLAIRSLQDLSLPSSQCARIVIALEVVPVYVFPLSISSFDGEPLIARLARRPGVWQARAADVLQRIRDNRTLLRAAEGNHTDVLLRPLSSANPSRQEALLRASDKVELPTVSPVSRTKRPSITIADIMRRLFDRSP